MQQEYFLRNKINRQIKQNGSEYLFKRYGVDEYDQLTDEIVKEMLIKGLFHETINHIHEALSEADGARITDVPQSYILCLFDDGDQIKLDDFVEINERIYKVINKTNVGNFNVAYDINLRMEVDGSKT